MKTSTFRTPTPALFLTLLAACWFAACSSNPLNKAKDLKEEPLEKKGEYKGATIGVTEDRDVVIRKESTAEDELRKLAAEAYELELQLTSDHDLLTRCREELADPRLGGNGKVVEIPEIEKLRPIGEVKEEFGITSEGKLSFVRKELFGDHVSGERKYIAALKDQIKHTSKHRKNCEREMRPARVKAGLPAERFSGKGHYKNGKYIQTRRSEQNLDDAFAIQSEEAAAGQKSP
jgi:hypothetical protein